MSGLDRRDFLRLSALLGASTSLGPLLKAGEAFGATESTTSPVVRIGYLPITDAAPLLVAHAKNLYEAEGLTVEKPRLFRSWAQLAEAFISGQVNVVHLLSPTTVWLRYGSQVPAKVVAWNHIDGSAITVHAGIQHVGELGGQTVAVPFWYSMHNIVLQHVLRQNGLTPVLRPRGAALSKKEVNLVVMAPSDMIAALSNRSIAGFTVAEPFNASAELLKIGRVLRFTGDVWKDHACCVVLMHEKDTTQRPEWTQRVVNAVVKAQHWMRSHRVETATLLAKEGTNQYTPHPLAALERVLVEKPALNDFYVQQKSILHPEWKSPRIDFQPYPYASYTEELVKMLKNTVLEGNLRFIEKLSPKHVAADLVDPRFVRAAIKQLGGPKAFGIPESLARTELIV